MLTEIKQDGIIPQVHSIYQYTPMITPNGKNGRPQNAFVYILEGGFLYHTGPGALHAAAGDILYIPYGSSYRYEVQMPRKTQCMQIEFSLYDSTSGQPLALAEHPCVLPIFGGGEVKALFSELVAVWSAKKEAHDFAAVSGIYRLLYLWRSAVGQNVRTDSRLWPALDYLKNHFTERVTVGELAKLCFLSESQLWRMFKNQLGYSPIEYKNKLLFDAAGELLLRGGGQSISEIAYSLGFDSIYTFSQLFKKHMGCSPSAYRKKVEGEFEIGIEKG